MGASIVRGLEELVLRFFDSFLLVIRKSSVLFKSLSAGGPGIIFPASLITQARRVVGVPRS